MLLSGATVMLPILSLIVECWQALAGKTGETADMQTACDCSAMVRYVVKRSWAASPFTTQLADNVATANPAVTPRPENTPDEKSAA